MTDHRLKLWHNILDDLGPPEGCIMPPWLIAVRLAIFPINTAYVLICDHCQPFDIWRQLWTIYGVEYTDQFFRQMSIADGTVFKIERINDRITLTRYNVDLLP